MAQKELTIGNKGCLTTLVSGTFGGAVGALSVLFGADYLGITPESPQWIGAEAVATTLGWAFGTGIGIYLGSRNYSKNK
jgi:hypothetical protein